MKAVCWMGKESMAVQNVPDPKLINPKDAIIRVTRTAICGSDLHLYGGYIPTMESGDIMGHEFMGIVEEVGKDVKKLKRGDRVVVPFTIACGNCFFCKKDLWSVCDNTNPNAQIAETMYGYTGAGLFGFSHLYGGYAGGQAQYARIPFADVGPIKIESDIPDEKVLFLSDIFPTGYQGAVNANIEPGDTVAVWGCGPVGLFAIASAYMLGAEKVIAIDRFPERLKLAKEYCGATVIDYSQDDINVVEALRDITGGIGPDGCIDAVGMEAHSATTVGVYDKVKQTLMQETDRPFVLRQAIQAVRKGGTLSIPGVYGGFLDKVNFGAAFGKGIHMNMGQTHMQAYLKPLLDLVEQGQIDPTFLISHRIGIEQAPGMYATWQKKQDGVTKIVIDPWTDTLNEATAGKVV
ncbi:MAG: zinc-dependent alcohol dehydrogenase [Janthinobacterium lividum]